MLTIKYQAAFKRDYKRLKKRGYDIRLLEKVIGILAEGKTLPSQYKDHGLNGDYKGAGNATSPRTGCWCTRLSVRSFSCTSPERELTATYFNLKAQLTRLRFCYEERIKERMSGQLSVYRISKRW